MNGLSTTSALEPLQDRGLAAGGRDREPVFRRAMRHSRRVRRLRFGIPVVAGLLLGGTVMLSWLDPLRVLVTLPGDSGRLVISGTKITMEAPKLSGYTRDSRWYELTARAAAQDITRPNMIELHDVRAKLEAEDKSTMQLNATEGTFDRKAGMLKLSRDIVLRSTSGYEVLLQEAEVETATGAIVSNKPVEVRTQKGTINANGLEVSKAGEVIRFTGGVVANLSAGTVNFGDAPVNQ